VHVAWKRANEKNLKNLIGNPEGKRYFGIHRRIWKDAVKMHFKTIV
jgi:hypothetical protein